MKRSEKPKKEEEESELPKVEVFSPSEGKPSTGDLVASESRVEYRSPTYSEAPPRRVGGSRGESGLRTRPAQRPSPDQRPAPAQRPMPAQRPVPAQRPAASQRAKQSQLPRPKQPRQPPPPQQNRREGFHFQDNYAYDPRPPQDPNTSAAPQIFPIPIEFINQIPGVGQPLQQGSIRLEPESTSFQPSSHIEQIVNGIPKLVEETSDPFFLEVELDPKKQNPTARSLHHQETPIFREEYPRPQGTPYPPVPYHDTRHEVSTPTSTATQATGEGGTAFRYMAAPHKVLHDGVMVPPLVPGDLTRRHPERRRNWSQAICPPSVTSISLPPPRT